MFLVHKKPRINCKPKYVSQKECYMVLFYLQAQVKVIWSGRIRREVKKKINAVDWVEINVSLM